MLTMRQGIRSLFTSISELVRRGQQGFSAPLSPGEDGRPRARITVVGLAIGGEDRRVLSTVSSRSQWNVLFADTCEKARAVADQLRAPVILCDRDLPGEDWRNVVEALASSPHRTCIVLVSKVVDEYLWNETVQRGGYDVLSKPLREEDVVRVVRLAWSYWNTARRGAARPATHR